MVAMSPWFVLGSGASDAAALGRTATVVGRRGDVLDGPHLEAGRLQRTDRRLAARARTLDEHVDLAHAVLLRTPRGGLGSHLRRERRRLARALEADLAGGRPRDHRTGRVGDRDDRVVERALDVGVPVGDVLLLLATRLARRSGCGPLLRRHVPRTPVGWSRESVSIGCPPATSSRWGPGAWGREAPSRESARGTGSLSHHARRDHTGGGVPPRADRSGLLLSGLLLARHRALRALARARVGAGALTVHRQAATVPQPLVAADL